MTAQTGTTSKTLGFTTLFLIEMWERFGYYGMTAVVVVFMAQKLGYGEENANLTFGAFTGIAYAIPAIGGWIGDKVLGSRRTALLGAAILVVGYAMLAMPDPSLLFLALAVIAIGGGLFKSNPANLISKLYEGESAKIDSAFTMYYMSVNVGAALSQIVTPLVAQYYSWHLAFAICSGGLVVGIINYFIMRRHLAHVGSPPDFKPLDVKKFAVVLIGAAASVVLVAAIIKDREYARDLAKVAFAIMIVIFGVMIYRGNARERKGLIAVAILTAQTMLFFIFYQQMSTSLTFFAVHNVNLDLYGFQVPATMVQWFDPFWIFVLSPPLAWSYHKLSRGKGDFHIATKFAAGFVVLSLGFFIYGVSALFAADGVIGLSWMFWGYCLQSLGELLISGLGLAMISRYVGPSLRGFIMGTWFLATGISQYLGGFVANYASVPKGVTDPVQSLPLYSHLFNNLGLVALVGTVLAIVAIPYMKWLSKTGGETVSH
ncbi:MAG TPA: oligopeptide:H+ symporter [Gammaproteobacteria bacterium]|nr:oligopeptide:H+ symporter [Gammaproteobacteria bacterium]